MFFFSSKPKNNEKEMIKNAPEGAVECRFCKGQIPGKTLAKNYYVCPECGKPLPIPPRSRMAVLADKGSFSEFSWGLRSVDFLEFPGYKEKLEKAERVTGEKNAVLCGTAKIDGHPCVIFIMDSRFMMASMGSVVGEKLTRTFEYATAHRLPVIGFAASGGARMQEGILSLMQMAKVSAAVGRHSEGGNLYISVLTNPTTGGVTASFAMQGDIILAEPYATVGFAGRRVVEQTTKTALPDNFQSAEFVYEHGFIDRIVPREALRDTLATLLLGHQPPKTEGKK